MDVTFFEQSTYFSKFEIQGENQVQFQPWEWNSLLVAPEPNDQPETTDILEPQTKSPPKLATREVRVYSRRLQEEIKT